MSMVLVPKAQCQSESTLFIAENPHSQAAFAVLSLLDYNFKLLFFGGLRFSSPLALATGTRARKKLFLTYVMKTIAPKPRGTTTPECTFVTQSLGVILLASG